MIDNPSAQGSGLGNVLQFVGLVKPSGGQVQVSHKVETKGDIVRCVRRFDVTLFQERLEALDGIGKLALLRLHDGGEPLIGVEIVKPVEGEGLRCPSADEAGRDPLAD